MAAVVEVAVAEQRATGVATRQRMGFTCTFGRRLRRDCTRCAGRCYGLCYFWGGVRSAGKVRAFSSFASLVTGSGSPNVVVCCGAAVPCCQRVGAVLRIPQDVFRESENVVLRRTHAGSDCRATAVRGDDLFEGLLCSGLPGGVGFSVLLAVMSFVVFCWAGIHAGEQRVGPSRDTTAACHRALTALHETNPGRSFVGALLLACSQVGTGFHGTLPGNVYCFRPHILDDIRAFKGMEPAPQDEPTEDVLNTSTASEVRRRRWFHLRHGDMFFLFSFFRAQVGNEMMERVFE